MPYVEGYMERARRSPQADALAAPSGHVKESKAVGGEERDKECGEVKR